MKHIKISTLLFLLLGQITSVNADIKWLPVIASSPETGFQYGLLLLQSLDEEAVDGKLSSIQYIAINSTEDQQRLVIRPTLYYLDYKLLLTPTINYSSFPEKYYGLGNDTDEDNEEDFSSDYLFLELEGQYNIFSDFHLLFRTSSDDREITEFEDDAEIDTFLTTGIHESEYTLKSLGYGLVWDTRNHPRYPNTGYYAEISQENFEGGAYDYDEDVLDLRAFFSVGDKKVLGAHYLQIQQDGEIPFINLATIGGSDVVRGIFEGRYRSDEMHAVQLEYRQYGYDILGIDIGFTAFAAAGKVEPVGNEDDGIHTGVGVGGHFFFNPEDLTTIRLDVAYGDGEPGIYLMIDQAF